MDDDNFYSINRLVEFGMGISIAQQMIKSMNDGMNNMHVPGAMNSMPPATPHFFYAILNGSQAGPFTEQDISQLFTSQQINRTTYFWKPGMQKWEIAEKIPEILKIVALTPPPLPKTI
jgi:hypothetical protein